MSFTLLFIILQSFKERHFYLTIFRRQERIIMKKPVAFLNGIFFILLLGCGPSLRTEKIPLPPSPNRGSLEVVIKPAEGITPTDTMRLKKVLTEKFLLAGFNPVETEDSRSNAGRAVELTVTKYEHKYPAKDEGIFAGVGCVYICPLFAPCLLLPGYYEPQFEIVAEVSLYNKGRRVFKKVMSEKSKSSSNLINTGDEEFKSKIEELTVHNFTVAFLKELAKQ